MNFHLNLFLQQFQSTPLNLLMLAVSVAGSRYCFMAVLPLLYWTTHRRKAWYLAAVFMLSMELNAVLKIVFHHLRPFQLNPAVRLIGPMPHTFAFPSGHAQGGAVLWGGIAIIFPHIFLFLAATSLVFLIGVSRIYLGVHSAADVLFGWTLGLLSCAVLFALLRYSSNKNKSIPTMTIRFLCAGAACSLMIIYPEKDVFISGITFTALMLLEPLERKWIRFPDADGNLQRLRRSVAGFFPAALLLLLYKIILPQTLVFHIITFSALSSWMVLGAPWLFRKKSF